MIDKNNLLQESPLLRLLPKTARAEILACFHEQKFGFGETIVREGDEADSYYLIIDGRVRVTKRGDDGHEIQLQVLETGDSFGEIGLLTGSPRTATVRASQSTRVLRLERDDFNTIVGENPELHEFVQLQLQNRSLLGFMRQYTRLADAPLPLLRRLLELLEPQEFEAGAVILREEEKLDSVLIIVSGKLVVRKKDDTDESRVVAYLRAGDYIGERSLLHGKTSGIRVEAQSPVRLQVLSAENWETLRGEYPSMESLIAERKAVYEKTETELRVPLDFVQEPGDWNQHSGPSSAAEMTDEEAAAVKTTKGRLTFIPQIDDMDCGVACLAMVCDYHGRQINRNRLRELTGTTVDGAASRDICGAAEELGLSAVVVKKDPRNLDQLPTPAMLHLEPSHWVVLIETNGATAKIADPADKIESWPIERVQERWTGYAIVFERTEKFDTLPLTEAGRWDWLLPILRPLWTSLAAILTLTVLISACQVLLPVFIQKTIDEVIGASDQVLHAELFETLYGMVIALVLALVATLLLMLFQRFILSRVAIRLDRSILDQIFRRMLKLPVTYFLNRSPADIQRRLVGSREIRLFLMQNCTGALVAIVQVLIFLGVMFYYSPRMSVWFLAVMVPIYFGLVFFGGIILRPAFEHLQETETAFQALQQDVVEGIQVVKASGSERRFRQSTIDDFLRITREQGQNQFNISTFDGTVQAIWVLSSILFLWLGARLVIVERLSLGAFIAFLILIGMLYAPVMTIVKVWADYLSASLYMARLQEILQWRTEPGLGERPPSGTALQGKIEFRDVAVCLAGNLTAPTLQSISFAALPGQRIGIVGRSGSGKTILAKTMATLIEPSEGRILFDDVPVSHIRLDELRRQIGLVLQQEYLFHGTIEQNISFGDPKSDLARVEEVARMVGIHEAIMDLPAGYKTDLSSCFLLDTGLRQGIAIARVLCRDPAVLILDAATGLMDVESESILFDNLEAAFKNRTVIVFTQRPGLIRHADEILVLDQGRIVERGRHDELTERCGLYYHLSQREVD